MSRSGLFAVAVIVLLAVGGYFFFMSETAVNDAAPALDPNAAVPAAVGDTAPFDANTLPLPGTQTPPPEEAPQDLIPSNE